MEKPLVNDRFLLKKFEMKGGWTYTEIDSIKSDQKAAFGYVRVRGTIDGFEVKQFNLMPMQDGRMFFPVRSEIRKAIKKQAGDWVQITLFLDDSAVEVPDELLVCLLEAPAAHAFFEKLTESNKKYYIDWIFGAKRMETRVERLAKTLERLEKGLKLYDQE